MNNSNIMNYSLIGHKGRSFDIRLSSDQSTAISSSEDSTVKLWNLQNKKVISTISHNRDIEVLRASFITDNSICTCTSDGEAFIWRNDNDINKCTLQEKLCHDNGQIYTCEIINDNTNTYILTAADNILRLWDSNHIINPNKWTFENDSTTTPYGGPRNPDNVIYIFDAKVSNNDNNTIAVALSDGSINYIDRRNNLSPRNKMTLGSSCHVTSVTWSYDSNSVISSLGNGQIVIVDYRMGIIRAVLTSHKSPCFGTSLYHDDRYLISWSSDGSIRLWNYKNYDGIISNSLDEVLIEDFPIYSCVVNQKDSSILCAGGSSKGKSFLGVPIHSVKSFKI